MVTFIGPFIMFIPNSSVTGNCFDSWSAWELAPSAGEKGRMWSLVIVEMCELDLVVDLDRKMV